MFRDIALLRLAVLLQLPIVVSCQAPDSPRAAEPEDADSAMSHQAHGASSTLEVARVRVTYSGGDAVAGPQTLTGKDDSTGLFLTGMHTVTIDFLSLLSDACQGDTALSALLQPRNPITAIHVLELNTVDPATSGGNHIRWGNIAVIGQRYDVLFSDFQERTSVRDLMVETTADAQKTPKTYVPRDWDGYVLVGGRFYVIQTAPRRVRLNCPRVVDLEINIARPGPG